MSCKISITMPDELFGRLEKVRDKFNISKVCQEAIAREVRIQELSTETANDEAVIERLKLQKAQNELTSGQLGTQDGAIMARNMSYLLLKALEAFEMSTDELDNPTPLEVWEKLSNVIPESEQVLIGSNIDLDEFLYDKATSCDIEFEQYIVCFLRSTSKFLYETLKTPTKI